MPELQMTSEQWQGLMEVIRAIAKDVARGDEYDSAEFVCDRIMPMFVKDD